jgi:lysyl-tRNA synthetase class 2
MPRVESSMMTQVEYDDDAQELDILFASGKRYRYFGVPPDIYAELLDAESKGQFFNEEIKDVYPFSEVRSRPRR